MDEEDTRAIIVILGILLFLSVMMNILTLYNINYTRTISYCGSNDYKYTTVKNLSNTQYVNDIMGYRCCKKKTWVQTFDNRTGEWNSFQKQDCFYVPKHKVRT